MSASHVCDSFVIGNLADAARAMLGETRNHGDVLAPFSKAANYARALDAALAAFDANAKTLGADSGASAVNCGAAPQEGSSPSRMIDALAGPALNGLAFAHISTAFELMNAGHTTAALSELRAAHSAAQVEYSQPLPKNIERNLDSLREIVASLKGVGQLKARFFCAGVTSVELERLTPGQCVAVVEKLAGTLAMVGAT